MKIDKEAVRRVALLSRLSLAEDEMSEYGSQLGAILEYISKLNEIDTRDVPPTSHTLSTLKNVYRKDILKPSLKTEEALKNAPEASGDFFKVPQIIEKK